MATDSSNASSPVWTWLALIVAAAISAGSIYLSLGMGLKPCPLCYYQRTFAFAATGILLMGVLVLRNGSLSSLMALPLVAGAVGVAGFHVYLEMNGTLECPKGVFELGTAPQQSFFGLVVLLSLLLFDVAQGKRAIPARPVLGTGFAILLGALITFGCMRSAPPLPKPPDKAYDSVKQPLVGCRAPYTGS